MSESENRSVLAVGHDGGRLERVADVLRASGMSVTQERRGPAAAVLLGQSGAVASGLLVVDLALPELDRQRLRQALGESAAPPESLDEVERRHIAAMLRHTGGNRRRAAQLLGLARSTLLAKIRRYHLETPSEHPVEAEV